MLVLTRRTDQRIVFPETGIAIQVLSVKGNVVKLGVEAPRDVTVLRAELRPDFVGSEVEVAACGR